MTTIEREEEPTALDQVTEMIKEALEAQESGINTPELDAQIAGLILRKTDLLDK